ncbi:uncharacterized protein LOC143607514 isoform X2 [Bidens hawaiensis]|uniref:uncharacterized protein LOC143607514 isoform X2 n=1 Tax=Bidens hawaiensis TaxID=980011 RepID=UPI00404A0830
MKGSNDDSKVAPVTSSSFSIVISGPPRLRVVDEVFFKSILNPTEPVARGWVKSLDPNELVGGTEIGPKWCEVVREY